MALAPVVLRLRSFCLTSPAAGVTVRRMCLFSFQSPSPAGHRAYATDDQNDRKDAEDQDVEHAALDHVFSSGFPGPFEGQMRTGDR
jgi:hypothetical protein